MLNSNIADRGKQRLLHAEIILIDKTDDKHSQSMVANGISNRAGQGGSLCYVVNFHLLYNAALMVKEGLEHTLYLGKIARSGSGRSLCFIPLEQRLQMGPDIVLTKHKLFPPAAQLFWKVLEKRLRIGIFMLYRHESLFNISIFHVFVFCIERVVKGIQTNPDTQKSFLFLLHGDYQNES